MLRAHPLAELFPMMSPQEHAELVADMRANGFRMGEEIVLLDGQILDGRNRYRAGLEAGVLAEDGSGWEFVHFSSDGLDGCFDQATIERGPLAFVLSKNLHRRHLNESQRAMVAARLATMRQGERTDREPSANLRKVSQPQAAESLGVSARLVQSAKVVEERGTPELKRAVDEGKLAVSAAAQAARLPEETQRRIAEESDAGRANVVRTVIKKEKRASREAQLAEKQRALPQKKYGVIVADPEWRFEPYSRETGMDRAPDNHYPTSDTLDIIVRPVGAIAADDAVLWLWATAPMLPQALAVMKGWGFAYKSHLVWRKVRPGAARGSGYWFTGEHELLLVGTRGALPAPATALCGSVISAPVGEHSAKPEEFLALIERAFPNLPKIELNRRGPPRAGWDAWGNEAEIDAATVSRETIDDGDAPLFGEDDRTTWKALFALDGGIMIEGPILATLLDDGLIELSPRHPGYALTPRGQSMLGMLDNYFNPPSRDGGNESLANAVTEIVAMEGAPAPAAEGVNGAASRLAGGRTPDGAEGSVADPSAPHPLDIPDFLRRVPRAEAAVSHSAGDGPANLEA